MLKSIRILALLLFLSILVVSCTYSPIVKPTRSSANTTPTPTTIIFTYPVIDTPTPAPQRTPSCFLGLFFCSEPTTTPCRPDYVYDDLIDMGTSWIVVYHQSDQNNDQHAITVTFKYTSTASVTETVSDSLSLTLTSSTSGGVSIDEFQLKQTITESVRYTINNTVSQSVSVTISNSPTVTVPAGKIASANYGAQVQVTEGRLYDKAGCEGANSYFGPDITYVPIATGWCVWESGGTPCPSIQQ